MDASRDWVLLYMVFAVILWLSPTDGDSPSCTPSINIPRNAKFRKSEGESLLLKCPVRVCAQVLPPVTWCKLDKNLLCDAVIAGYRISSVWEEHEGQDPVYLLKFISVQINDSGYYRCSAFYGELQIMGGQIEINITATGTTDAASENMRGSSDTISTTASPKSALYHYKWFLHIVISLGALCVLIIAVSLLVVCVRKVKEKSRSSDVAAEEKFVAVPENAKTCPEQMAYSSPSEAEFTAVSTEVTYDNAHLGSRSTTLNAPETPVEEDSIVYADLNHEAKRATFQCEDDCDVEYVAMNVRRH